MKAQSTSVSGDTEKKEITTSGSLKVGLTQ